MKFLFVFFFILIFRVPSNSGLLISEIACASPGGDWVEIYFQSDKNEKMDISGLYVTMYYGNNEPLALEPVTIYSYDRPETPYDDRFIVVHLTDPVTPDETDITGDSNHNGYIDLYCNNYSGSLWNSDCIVAIDRDDDPANGGIIDFAAYSNRDGSPNETIAGYVEHAQALGQWETDCGPGIQQCMTDIGANGILQGMSISRKSIGDTNSSEDFQATMFQTPGKENIISSEKYTSRYLFLASKKVFTFVPTDPLLGSGEISLYIYEACSIRFRIFSSTGMLVHESPLHKDLYPGTFKLKWDLRSAKRSAASGLYIGHIEGTSRNRRTDRQYIYIILSRYK